MRKPFYFTVCFIITSMILTTSCTDKTEPEAFSLLAEKQIEILANTWKKNNIDTPISIKFVPPIIKFEDIPDYHEEPIRPAYPIEKEEEEPKEKKPYVIVEQMPEFPGGQEAMKEYIYSNLHYPSTLVEMGIEGRVTLRFTVTKEGDIKDILVIRGVEKDMDREAIRVVDCMPKWEPGKQNGEAVDVYFTLPIVFRIPK